MNGNVKNPLTFSLFLYNLLTAMFKNCRYFVGLPLFLGGLPLTLRFFAKRIQLSCCGDCGVRRRLAKSK